NRSEDCFYIKWFYGMDINDLSTYALFGQDSFCLNGMPPQMSRSEYRYVFSFDKTDCFSYFELLIRGGEDRNSRSSKPQVHGAFILGNRYRGSFRLIEIAGIDYGHVRHHLHHANIFQDLVCGTVFS